MGRFAQADTIVPGGVQGYDRYAYVNNSPINYTDPSGNIPIDCYDAIDNYCGSNFSGTGGGGGSVSLTSFSDPGFNNKFSGEEVYQAYQLMAGCTDCWWSSNGPFTIEMFIGFMIMQEANYPQSQNAMAVIKQIFAQRLYVGGGTGETGPYCSWGLQCYNGVFNYLAATTEAARDFVTNFVRNGQDIHTYAGPGSVAQYIGKPGGDEKVNIALDTASSLGNYALRPTVLYGFYTGPSEYGNVSQDFLVPLRTNNVPDYSINGLAANTMYLYFQNAAYFSLNQHYYWLDK